MDIENTIFEDVFIIHTPVYEDERGSLFESFTEQYNLVPGMRKYKFVHEIVSTSIAGVFRGLHYQEYPYEQGKLIQVLSGEVLDIIIDLRPKSKTYKRSTSIKLDAKKHNGQRKQLWIPPGFAHGFLSLFNNTTFHYKCTLSRVPQAERTLLLSEVGFNMDKFKMSEKDKNGMTLKEYEREQNEKI